MLVYKILMVVVVMGYWFTGELVFVRYKVMVNKVQSTAGSGYGVLVFVSRKYWCTKYKVLVVVVMAYW